MDDSRDQRSHWEGVYSKDRYRFGEEPSPLARDTLQLFRREGTNTIAELGCGHGRDAIFFLKNGIEVKGFDYAETGLCGLEEKARELEIEDDLYTEVGDIRVGIPIDDESVDACYSHMFFTMELTEAELEYIFQEVHRILKPGGLCIYSVRNVNDPHYGRGEHRGEDMWEMNDFVVHYFSEEKVKRYTEGFRLLTLEEFEEGGLPKRLFKVVLRKV